MFWENEIRAIASLNLALLKLNEGKIMYWDQVQINEINSRLELIEKVFIKIMQHDIRLQTLEFNSDTPVQPSAAEKLMDMQMRLERLESYLLNGEK